MATAAVSPFFTFALAFYTCITVGRLHEVVPILVNFYVGKVSALLLLVAFAMEMRNIPFAEALRTKTAKCIGAVTVLGVLSVPLSAWPGQSAQFLRTTWPLIALLGIAMLVGMRNPIVARRTLAALTIVATMAAAQLLAGGGLTEVTVLGNTVGAAVAQRAYIGGGGSSTYDSNYTAAFFVMMIPYALMFATRKGLMRWVGIAAVPILGMAMIKTGSRGGIIALAVLGIAIVAFSDKKSRPIQIAIMAVGLGAMMLSPHSDLAARLQSLVNGQDYNFDARGGRWQLWTNGITMLFHRPVLGVGIYAFPVADFALGAGFMDAHNSFVHIAAELGFPGIAAFLIMIVAAFKSLIAMRKRSLAIVRSGQANEQASLDLALSTAALCALIAELSAAFFLSLAYEAMTMFALTVPIGITLSRGGASGAIAAAARRGGARLRGMRPRGLPPQRPQQPAAAP